VIRDSFAADPENPYDQGIPKRITAMYDYLIKNATIVDGLGDKPYSGDVAIEGGKIAAVGKVDGSAKETINADGAYATPGWVDVHTHFDGQVSWDDKIDPSFSHGVTSVVMGNCGVGFAPCPPGGERGMIELMEGVEDIPGTALFEGIEWGEWETFPEYIDYLGTKQYTLDVGTQIPHSAVRNYVMGERALRHEDATSDDLEAMSKIVREGLNAGALGFSTSRTIGHRSILGEPIPGTFAEKAELLAIGRAMKEVNKGVFQAVPAGVVGDIAGPEKWTTEQEVELFAEIARESGRSCTFTLVQNGNRPDQWRKCLDIVEKANAEGISITPQIATRPIGFVTSIQTYHMFQRRETFLKLSGLPFTQLLAELKKPDVRAAILADKDVPPTEPGAMANIFGLMAMTAPMMFPIEMPINYEPEASGNMGALAAVAGKDINEFMYDYLTAGEGGQFAILLGANFVDGSFSVMEDMIRHPYTTIGLSDAGAHVNLIFDAVGPTYQLTHWVRDRTRGDRMPIELMVRKQTHTNAQLFGMTDRGSLQVGKRADLNLFDLDRLGLGRLEVHHDLPAGGSRILQSAEGYLNTFVAGVKTRENDQDTGARPGRVIRV
jgi:N-acyl-D-aspartate/D-glutamate deacylase